MVSASSIPAPDEPAAPGDPTGGAIVLDFHDGERRLRPAGVYTANLWRRTMRKRAADLTVPEPEGWEPPPPRYA